MREEGSLVAHPGTIKPSALVWSFQWIQLTFFLKAANLFFLVTVLMYVPSTNETMLKNGTQVCSGKNFCAKAKAIGLVTQLTFMIGINPARMVARIWWNVLAPAMTAMEAR
jgi:hypothetical protein